MSSTLGLLLISAGLGVHLEEVVDLPLRDATAVAEYLAEAAEIRSGLKARVDDPLAPSCRRRERCLGDVAARTDAVALIFVRLIGGVTKIRVVAKRLNTDGRQVSEAVVNLPRRSPTWRRALDRLAGILFPEPVQVAEGDFGLTAQVFAEDEPSRLRRAAPWLLVGLGVASGVAGLVLGLSAASARSNVESLQLTGDEYTDSLDRMRTHGTAANVLFGVAAGSSLTGLIWLLVR